MEKMLDDMPGIKPAFSQPIRDNVLESISQIDGQIVIKIFGDDSNVLKAKIEEVLKVITPDSRRRAGVRGPRRTHSRSCRSRSIVTRAARYGLNVADIEDVIETALGGRPATQIWEGERRFSVVVRMREDERSNVDALRGLLLDAPDGSQIPLDQVAKIGVQDGVHEHQPRRRDAALRLSASSSRVATWAASCRRCRTRWIRR